MAMRQAAVKRRGASAKDDKVMAGKSKPSEAIATTKLPPQSRKRKAADSEDLESDKQPTKIARGTSKKTRPVEKGITSGKDVQTKPQRGAPLNHPKTQILDIYVFGEGSAGELGLGAGLSKDVMNVKRPRLNQRLNAKSVGVVQVAVGGMHCAALTHDNKILTWGVNDQSALGRETDEGPLVDMKDEASSDSESEADSGEDSGLNASEAEPREVDPRHFPAGTTFVQLVAADSSTFALTTTGLVYGWGTFRGNDGILGFRSDGPKIQPTPIHIPELKDIISLATGTNHILALDSQGKLFMWGAGEQNQLGRRIVARTAVGALVPRRFRLGNKKFLSIGCGDYHSYAIDSTGVVYAWGLNSFAQCGAEPGDGDSSVVPVPTVVETLRGFKIQKITGGAHHAIALTADGQVLVWGRANNKQAGVDLSQVPANSCFKDDKDVVAYLTRPVVVPGLDCIHIATASDTCAAITRDGKAFTWGFNGNYQTGQGKVDDVAIAQLVDNTAVRGKKLVFAGLGGQFGVLGGIPVDD